MTPPATAAARSAPRQAPGPRRNAVRHPRRISGPARPARSAALAGGAVAVPAPGIALPAERPQRSAAPRRRSARRSVQGTPGIALRAVDAFEGISTSAVLDRLIRGRAWIGLLAFALIGIVAMQLLVLKLNTGIGRTLAREALLQRQNAQLGVEDSMSSAEGRVEPLAAAAGMTLAPAGTVHFVVASHADVARAAAALSTAVPAPEATSSTEGSGSSSAQVAGAQTAASGGGVVASSAEAGGSGGGAPAGQRE